MLKCIKCGKYSKQVDLDSKGQCKRCLPPKTEQNHMKYGKFIQDLKRETGCHFCKEKDPVALDYHHVYSTSKKFGLGSIRGQSAPEIYKEISKCIVLCSNCHRKLHAGRLNLSNKVLNKYKSYSPHRKQR